MNYVIHSYHSLTFTNLIQKPNTGVMFGILGTNDRDNCVQGHHEVFEDCRTANFSFTWANLN